MARGGQNSRRNMNRRRGNQDIEARRRAFGRALLNDRHSQEELLEMISPDLVEDEGRGLLYDACSEGASVAVVEKLASFNRAALHTPSWMTEPHQQQDRSSSRGVGDIPVFAACLRRPPCLDTVELLVDLYPGCLLGSSTHIPLYHCALRLKMSEATLNLQEYIWRRTVKAGTDILSTRDFLMYLPIHHLAQGHNVELMKQWLGADPTLWLDTNPPHNSLLHFAVGDIAYTGHNPTMVEYLANKLSRAMLHPNAHGELPIHCALWPQDRELLLRHQPYSLLRVADDGLNPIERVKSMVDNIATEIDSGDDDDKQDVHGLNRLRSFFCRDVLPAVASEIDFVMQLYGVPTHMKDLILEFALPADLLVVGCNT